MRIFLFCAALAGQGAAYWVPSPPPPGALVKEFDASRVKRVEVRAGAGLLRLEPTTGPTLTAIAVRRGAGPECRIELSLRDGKLTAAAEETSPSAPADGCAVDFTLRLPRAVELQAETGAAAVEGEGLKGPVRLRTGSGDVRLAWESAPPRGLVEVESGSGAVELDFPCGTRADASLLSGSGTVYSEFPDDRKARLRLRVRTGSGDIYIR